MAVVKPSQEEFDLFMKNGGDIVLEIDPTDISQTREFEKFPSLVDKLDSGFELPPTTLIQAKELLAQIHLYGSEWDKIFATVYICGGKVFFKRVSEDKYQAVCMIPKQTEEN